MPCRKPPCWNTSKPWGKLRPIPLPHCKSCFLKGSAWSHSSESDLPAALGRAGRAAELCCPGTASSRDDVMLQS